ncbi:sensor histidine kinase [Paraflavitalea pollutisoli]|uniref:sensor histidine kinase n=1 Tax=Paraflavitalea pollutisoli TaxID=3034143 RepID=UPI0023EDC3AD|nr:HAMP domain-containing sensor histidine kinase [Paraflavitalea sp. H1-2-19X]
MQYTIAAHKTTAIIGFLILSAVQVFLMYNTYELKGEKYILSERDQVHRSYMEYLSNDIVFPGASKIMDRYVWDYRMQLEHLYHTNRPGFDSLRQRLCDGFFGALRQANNFDTVLARISKKEHLRDDLQYVLSIQSMAIAFEKNEYVSLFDNKEPNPLISDTVLKPFGAVIGGGLTQVNNQNKIVTLMVSSPYQYNCRVFFTLNVDVPNRSMAIFKQMLLPLALSLFSILVMVVTFYITYRNWIRQKKLSEMKTDFINGITHEFHTPISAIIVANKVLLKDEISTDRESIRSMAQVVGRQAERLQHLIKRVLDITTTNQLKLQKERYSIHQVTDEILLAYRLKYAANNLLLHFHKDAKYDQVQLDQFWFTTLLLNILDNAVKYNDKPVKEITVSTSSDRRNIYLVVSDNGIGISKEELQHIFEKFYRHKRHQTGDVKGLGLGLFYVHQAVSAHNWKIQVDSVPGEGTRFTVIIPAQLSRVAEPVMPAAGSQPMSAM